MLLSRQQILLEHTNPKLAKVIPTFLSMKKELNIRVNFFIIFLSRICLHMKCFSVRFHNQLMVHMTCDSEGHYKPDPQSTTANIWPQLVVDVTCTGRSELWLAGARRSSPLTLTVKTRGGDQQLFIHACPPPAVRRRELLPAPLLPPAATIAEFYCRVAMLVPT